MFDTLRLKWKNSCFLSGHGHGHVSSELSHGFGVRWMGGGGVVLMEVLHEAYNQTVYVQMSAVGATKRGLTRELSNLFARPISHVLVYKISTRKADD